MNLEQEARNLAANALAKTNEGLDGSTEVLKSLIQFTEEQAPLLIEEMVMFACVIGVVKLILCLTLTIGFLFPVIKLAKKTYDLDRDGKDPFVPILLCIICLIPLLSGLTVLIISFSDWIKPWIAPRLFLLEEMARLSGLS